MAASDSTSSDLPVSPVAFEWPGAVQLDERLYEEVGRAERHGTPLSCLLVVVDNLEEMAGEHGGELREQTLAYVAGALRRELRRFDRVGMPTDRELVLVLPGADGAHAEMVARRVLDRLRAIKIEAKGQRRPLRISVGLSVWRAESTPATLLKRARAAAKRAGNGEAVRHPGPGAPLSEVAAPEPTSPPS